MSRENVEVVRRGFEAFARGDIEALLGVVDVDIEWAPAIGPILGVDATRGKAALRKFLLEDVPDGFEEFRAEPLSFEDHGDKVLVLTRYSGRGKASGVMTEQTFNTIYVLRDGAVMRHARLPNEGPRPRSRRAAGLGR